MKVQPHRHRPWLLVVGAVLSFSLVLAACSSSGTGAVPHTPPGSDAEPTADANGGGPAGDADATTVGSTKDAGTVQPSADAGPLASDTGRRAPDAGGAPVQPDAGAQVTADAGPAEDVAPLDATPPKDTAAPPADSGPADVATPPADAGSADAGPADTGPPAPPAEVRFIALGDAGKGNDTQYAVAAAMADKCAADGCDFVVLLGDNFYPGGVDGVDDPLWQDNFEKPYAALDVPFYALLGNHDNGGIPGISFIGGGAGLDFAKGDNEVAYTAVSDKWTMPARWYDFVAGPAHFFVIDTNYMMWAPVLGSAADAVDAEIATIGSKIAAAQETWKIVLGHHPYLSNGAHGNAGNYEANASGGSLMDIVGTLAAFLGGTTEAAANAVRGQGVKDGLDQLVCGKVDLYLCGHDHNRQWIGQSDACPGVQLAVSGAGAGASKLPGDDPVEWQDGTKGGFLWVHIVGATLHAEFIDEDGNVDFTKDITKP